MFVDPLVEGLNAVASEEKDKGQRGERGEGGGTHVFLMSFASNSFTTLLSAALLYWGFVATSFDDDEEMMRSTPSTKSCPRANEGRHQSRKKQTWGRRISTHDQSGERLPDNQPDVRVHVLAVNALRSSEEDLEGGGVLLRELVDEEVHVFWRGET